MNTPRNQGGLGPIEIPLLSDLTHKVSQDYGVYLEDAGHSLRLVSMLRCILLVFVCFGIALIHFTIISVHVNYC